MEKNSDKDEKNDNISSENNEIITTSSTKQQSDDDDDGIDNEHDDLEDGEIETDDDNDNDDEPIIISTNDTNSNNANIKNSSSKRPTDNESITSQIIDKTEHQNEITNSSSPIKLIGSSTESTKINSNKIDLTTTSNDKLTISSSSHASNKSISDVPINKKSKHRFVDDDWAGNVENAIAAALKKEGVVLPKSTARERVDPDSADSDEGIGGGGGGGGGGDVADLIGRLKNKVGKKRKKREGDKKSKKKMKHHDDTNDDIDDYEMLCIRGGSPPPITSSQMHHHSHSHHSHHPPKYYDSDNSYSSYDSFDSQEYKSVSHQERRQMRKMKDRRRKMIDREDRSGSGKRGGNNEKRKRNDDRDYDGICIPNMRGFCPEGDDCPRSHDARAQRKLELCKFYLMECCAKKDKCSYMHSDFPCKFYYLGMECIYKGACKFSHGKPLTEQLRQILLKHIETAPKEILGNFRRISRDHAVTLMNATHARLCAEQGIENTLASQTSTTTSLTTVTSNMMMPMMKQSQHEQLQQQQITGSSGATSSIPSLLDIVIKPPIPSPRKDDKSLSNLMTTAKGEKQRKSRWCDTNDINSLHGNGSGVSIGSGSPGGASEKGLSAPDVLSLRNLTGVITPEQIEKLAAMGIENLEQVNQLTVAQLNNLGLTIQQISEIQLNALNIEKLGLIKSPIHSMSSPSTTSTTCSYLGNLPPSSIVSTTKSTTSPISSNRKSTTTGTGNTIDFVNPTGLYSDPTATNPTQDIDMRFLIGTNTSENDHHRSASPIKTSFISSGIASPDAIQPAKSGVDYGIDTIMKNDTLTTSAATTSTNSIDYSQYLKDSNLDAEKTDLNDISLDRDDGFNEDEPELQIDESWMDPNDEEKNSNVKNDEDQNNDNEIKNENNSKTTIPKVSSPDIWKPSNLSSNNQNLAFTVATSPKYYQDSSNSENEEENWDTDDENTTKPKKKKKSNDDNNKKEKINYTSSNLLGLGIGNNETREFRGDPRLQKNTIQKSFGDYVPIISSFTTNVNDLSYNNSNNNDSNNLNDNWMTSLKTNSTTDVTELSTGTTKYQRASIYDGNPLDMDREDDNSTTARKKYDKDMRMSSFIDSTNSDIDLRLPFKPVMTNYTPATEIDGSISSHSPIPYKVYEIEIPKPSYSEIRRSIPVTEKTLDPRLRRIFCLKESLMNNDLEENVINQTSDIQFSSISRSGSIGSSNNNGQKRNEDQNDKITSNTGTNISNASNIGPRADPRRRKESQDNILGGGSTGSGSSGDKNQGVDIRLVLQKSNWYKNLNSKYKIMVNQQLALVSTELKKFHQDTTPNKVFDMSFLGTNHNLQQILSNLCIYIDEKGQLKELEGDNDGDEQSSSMSSMMGMGGMSGMDPNVASNVQQMVGAGGGLVMPGGVNGPGQLNAGMLSVMPGAAAAAAMYMRGGPPLNMGSGGSGGPIIPQFRPQRYDNIRPGLLGIAPGIQFNPFDPTSGTGNNMTDSGDSSGGYGNNSGGDDQNNFNAFLGCGSGSGNLFDQGNFFGRSGGNESGNSRGMRNSYRQGGSGGGGGRIQNDRWNSGGGVGGSGNRDSGNLRRNFDSKNRDGEGRRGNKKLSFAW